MTTTKSTPKIAARKKIAAAALALGAGVLGTGFAAGVIDFGITGESGFGQGQVSGVQNAGATVDITGRLTIDRPTTNEFNANTGRWQSTLDENLHITGFDALQNANGATYTVKVKYRQQSVWNDAATGTVDAGTEVLIPAVEPGGTQPVAEVSVMLEK